MKTILPALALALAAAGCGHAGDARGTAPAAAVERYEIELGAERRFPGAAGAFRVLTITDRRLCRTWTVLQSGGSANPPKVDGRDLSTGLVVLGVDNRDRPVK